MIKLGIVIFLCGVSATLAADFFEEAYNLTHAMEASIEENNTISAKQLGQAYDMLDKLETVGRSRSLLGAPLQFTLERVILKAGGRLTFTITGSGTTTTTSGTVLFRGTAFNKMITITFSATGNTSGKRRRRSVLSRHRRYHSTTNVISFAGSFSTSMGVQYTITSTRITSTTDGIKFRMEGTSSDGFVKYVYDGTLVEQSGNLFTLTGVGIMYPAFGLFGK